MKYYVRLKTDHNTVSYLLHKDRTKWCKRTAKKHAEEFVAKHPEHTYQLEGE